MYTLKVQNVYGQTLELTHNPMYEVEIEGLNPAQVSINTSAAAIGDGTLYNSSHISERNIVITLYLKNDIEKSRVNLYNYFMSNKVTRIFYKSSLLDVYIDGYMESFEYKLFELGQKVQISMICPNPLFRSVNETSTAHSIVTDLFEFEMDIDEAGIEFSTCIMNEPFEVYNAGSECGVMITMLFSGRKVDNPYIKNLTTGEILQINTTITEDSSIVINTNSGEKSIFWKRGTSEKNILQLMDSNSSWIRLRKGMNMFEYGTANGGDEYMSVNVTYIGFHEGV